MAYLSHGYLVCSHAGGADTGLLLVGEHQDFRQFVVLLQADVEHGVFLQRECAVPRLISQIREIQFYLSFGQGEGIETERIGGSAHMLTTIEDIGSNQRLGRRPVCHVSADGEPTADGFLW